MPFFFAGVIGGRNGWLKRIESIPRWAELVLAIAAGAVFASVFLFGYALNRVPWSALYSVWMTAMTGMYTVA